MREFLTPASLPVEPGSADIAPAWARSVVQVEGRSMWRHNAHLDLDVHGTIGQRQQTYYRIKKNVIEAKGVIEVEGSLPPLIGQTLALLHGVLICTRIVLIQVSLDVDPVIQWIISNNLIRSAGILDLLFAHPEIDKTCPGLGSKRNHIDRYFDETDWQSVEREMVRRLMHGPFYYDEPQKFGFQGSEMEATKCVNEFLLSMVERGEQDALLFVSDEKWSDWFCKILDDWTLIVLDRRRGLLSVLVMSETD